MDQTKGFAQGGEWLAPPRAVDVALPQVRDLASLGTPVEPGHVMTLKQFKRLVESMPQK